MRTAAEILQKYDLHPASTQPGRYYQPCPQCSAERSRAHQRARCLGITIDDKGVMFGCSHCGWTGGGYFNGRANSCADFVATHDYLNARGELQFQKVRNPPGHEPRFWCRQPDGKGGWINNIKGIDQKPLYRWPEVVEAITLNHEIAIAEGEKDCDRLWSIGIPATCNFDGAADVTKNPNVKPKWKSEYSEQLRGARLIVFNDNDPQGQAHADAICRMSSGIAKRVRRLDLAPHWPDMPRGADVSDWLAVGHTREELDALIESTLDWALQADAKSQATAAALPLTFFSDLSENPSPKPWLIKNILARDETSSWIAPPGKGKSALLTDLAVHKAGGIDWRGFHTKGRSGVVYFALERADLVRRRLIAHKLRDGLCNLPIAVVSEVIDLLNRNCVDAILATINTAEQRFACEVGLAIFDTYAKGIAAGGGDEDKAKDQNLVQANLRRLFDRGCHIHIAGVGHTGKDESKGERGSNARLADVDLQVQITGDVIKTATVMKANDQPEGVMTGFRLEPFNFSLDEDGEPFRTFIISPEIFAGERGTGRQKPTDRQVLALRALAEVTLKSGREPPPDYRLPLGIRVVAADVWREELLSCNALDRKAGNPWARFKELRDGMAARNMIGSKDDWVWIVRTPA
jgi:hypothetical protein